MEASRGRSSGAKTDELVIDYAFGSGHHAVTFFSLTDKTGTTLTGSTSHELLPATGKLASRRPESKDHEGDLTPMGPATVTRVRSLLRCPHHVDVGQGSERA